MNESNGPPPIDAIETRGEFDCENATLPHPNPPNGKCDRSSSINIQLEGKRKMRHDRMGVMKAKGKKKMLSRQVSKNHGSTPTYVLDQCRTTAKQTKEYENIDAKRQASPRLSRARNNRTNESWAKNHQPRGRKAPLNNRPARAARRTTIRGQQSIYRHLHLIQIFFAIHRLRINRQVWKVTPTKLAVKKYL